MVDVSDGEFCHYSRRNGPSIVLLSVLLLLSAFLSPICRICTQAAYSIYVHRYTTFGEQSLRNVGLKVSRLWPFGFWFRDIDAALCAIVGNFLILLSLFSLFGVCFTYLDQRKGGLGTPKGRHFLPSSFQSLFRPSPKKGPRKWNCLLNRENQQCHRNTRLCTNCWPYRCPRAVYPLVIITRY